MAISLKNSNRHNGEKSSEQGQDPTGTKFPALGARRATPARHAPLGVNLLPQLLQEDKRSQLRPAAEHKGGVVIKAAAAPNDVNVFLPRTPAIVPVPAEKSNVRSPVITK